MDDTRDVTEDGQQDVDKEVSAASALEEDTERGEDDGEAGRSQPTRNPISVGFCYKSHHWRRAGDVHNLDDI